ncbi:arginine--tRNA ligase [bacterium]|nr:MAG: arginine--tRNA ligase [bacterium]
MQSILQRLEQIVDARLEDAVRRARPGLDGDLTLPPASFAPARDTRFGDYSTPVVMQAAKVARTNPRAVGEEVRAALEEAVTADHELAGAVTSITLAGAGFLNVSMAQAYWQSIVAQVLREGADYGRCPAGNRTISLEFGSANPTGPVVVVQGRSTAAGSTLANMLRFCGTTVTVEWVQNDAGTQTEMLGRSLYARYRQLWEPAYPLPEDGYPGDYLLPVAQALRERDGDRWLRAAEAEWLEPLALFARDQIVAEQQRDMHDFHVDFDVWQSERELHRQGRVEQALETLKAAGHCYERDGALWFHATAFGDDKDRVLVRSDGRPTYYAGDIAYHWEKLRRGNERLIDIWGPDHHGYIQRMKAVVEALGHKGALEVLIAQQVTLKRGEEIVSSSKRQGQILTLREIFEEVGVDAARFFFLSRALDSHLTFDLDLAKQQTQDNPVYYVQYGHARIASVLRKAPAQLLARAAQAMDLTLLTHPAELALIKRLAQLADRTGAAAQAREPHQLTVYARELATEFHHFYTECQILGEDAALSSARLALCLAAKRVLATALSLMGISAPDVM